MSTTKSKASQRLLNSCLQITYQDYENAINLYLVCVGARPGARIEIMYDAVVDRAKSRGSKIDTLLLSKLDGIKFTTRTDTRSHSRKLEETSYLYSLLLEEHAGRILEDMRKLCDVHGVLVIPSRMEPYVIGKELQADKTLVQRLLLPSFDERNDETYGTVAKTLGYPVISLKAKRTGSVSVRIDVSDGRSITLMTGYFDDSLSSRKTVRNITDHTCFVARKTLVGLKLGSSRRGVICNVECECSGN